MFLSMLPGRLPEFFPNMVPRALEYVKKPLPEHREDNGFGFQVAFGRGLLGFPTGLGFADNGFGLLDIPPMADLGGAGFFQVFIAVEVEFDLFD